jgi:hypothetical protein
MRKEEFKEQLKNIYGFKIHNLNKTIVRHETITKDKLSLHEAITYQIEKMNKKAHSDK